MKSSDQFWFDLLDSRLSRRDLLRVARDVSGIIALGTLSGSAANARQLPRLRANPFTFGIASGDPWPESVVLWTRLDRIALQQIGHNAGPASVQWEVAEDDGFRQIVSRGTASAIDRLGYSVHVEVNGLRPARPYWYRFHGGGVSSPIGRTRTAPAVAAAIDSLRLVVASCQKYTEGFYTAYRHIASEDIDLILHLGDYIYEQAEPENPVRRQVLGEPHTLEEYRARYTLYRLDSDLQAAHAVAPWIVTFDDHEVDNNYADEIPEDERQTGQFPLRRTAAYQAYYEFMPLRRSSLPRGRDMQIYRRFDWSRLARFHVLDTRQYRSNQPCGDGQKQRCSGATDPAATMMGTTQENWLYDGLRTSGARWNTLANQALIAQLSRNEPAGRTFPMDMWDGYVAARQRLLSFIAERRPSNPVVLTGDIHSNWVADLKADFDDPRSPAVATEFAGTSISSGGDGRDVSPRTAAILADNPHIKFYNGQRGYLRCQITPERWTTDIRIVPYVVRPGAPISTRASFVVQNGEAGAVPG
ncbi:MAG: alkaline phosphatase D family protein [Gemmatimonadota bacterium]